VGVECEADEHELEERNAEHHREGDAVAPHLDHLLGEHRGKPSEGQEPVHARVSCALPMSWMNTSSRLVSVVLMRQPVSSATFVAEARRAAASRPTTCSVVPKGATCSTPGAPFRSAAARAVAAHSRTKVVSPAFRTTSATVPCA